MFWKEIFALNHTIILSIYGQVFFVLGLAIFMQSRRHSRLKLARDLRWLALFGILHALYEWGHVFIPIQTEYLPTLAITILVMAQTVLLAVSFATLLIFGFVLADPPAPGLRWLVIGLIAGWLLLAVFVHLADLPSPDRVYLLKTGARYLLALPGGLLAARGLYRRSNPLTAKDARYGRLFRGSAWSLVAYALVAGLVVAPAPFFPANVINSRLSTEWIGIPVEVIRSIVGLILTVSIIRSLEFFEAEVDHLIEKMEVESVRTAERERIGQEIHDGAMQGVYSVGLILDSMTKHIDNTLARQRLEQAQQVLVQVIIGLRRYMTSLRAVPPEGTLDAELAALTADPRFRSLIDIRLDMPHAVDVDASSTGHIVGLVQEALSNAARHARASQVVVSLRRTGTALHLTIQDDGQGFLPARVASGYGLLTMRNHAQLLGGQMSIDSRPGKGTLVKLILPCPNGRDGTQPTDEEATNG